MFLLSFDALGNHEGLEKVTHVLGGKLGANNVNLRKWVWSESNQWPSWDAISKAPIGFTDEWASFRIIMTKLLYDLH